MRNIDWIPPEPRAGLKGGWDKFVGPGATRAEFWLMWVAAISAGIALPVIAITWDFGWSTGKLIVAGLIACDMAGGVITNATSSAKRWYHRPGQGFKKEFGFVAIHCIQIFLVAWLFGCMDWEFFGVIYGYLLVSTLVILLMPLYLQRPVAMLMICGAILLNWYVVTAPHGFEWFVPVLFLKLEISHLLTEAPFRPDGEKTVENAPATAP
jgi:hypothetical protein